jgi:hypothetical protein
MTQSYGADVDPHPTHSRIGWSSVIAGALVAIAVGAMLNLIGMALGAGALGPFDLGHPDANAFTVVAGVWAALTSLVALFAGGFVASRAAAFADGHDGMLRGLAVWAAAFVVALVCGGILASHAPVVVDDSQLAPVAAAGTAAVAAPDATAAPPPGSSIRSDGVVVGPDGAPINQAASPATAPVTPAPVKPAATPATVALWAFLTMLLGAVGAIFGGRYGTRRHGWEARTLTTTAPPPPPVRPAPPPVL